MVRKPKRERKAAAAPTSRGTSDRDKAIDALMALLTEHSFEQIGLAEVAGRAGVKLSQLRAEFGSTLAILAAHTKDIDRTVLDGGDADMAEEPVRERLFDVLMRRLELLAPHKEAVRSLMRSARRDPSLALALNAMTVRSQQWMLTAAGINASGPTGMVRSQGLALLFANVLRTWVDDDDDQTRTLAALDSQLARGQRFVGLIDELCRIPQAACAFRDRLRSARRSHRRDRDSDTEDHAAI